MDGLEKPKKLELQDGFVFAFVVAITAAFVGSHGTCDMDVWLRWAEKAADFGIVRGYRAIGEDYPPFCVALLRTFVRIGAACEASPERAIKASIVGALALTSFVHFRIYRNATTTLATHVALLLGSAGLAYLDIYYAPLLLITFWALRAERWTIASLSFVVAFLIKWQPVIIAPFVALHFLRIERLSDFRTIPYRRVALEVLLPVSLLFASVVAVFGWSPIRGAFGAASHHNYLSANALNANWVMTHAVRAFWPHRFGPLVDGRCDLVLTELRSLVLPGKIAFVALYGATLIAYARKPKTVRNLVVCSMIGFLTYFVFNIGVHENHAFMPCLLAMVWMSEEPSAARPAFVVAAMYNLNVFLFYGFDGEMRYGRTIAGLDIALPMAVMYVAAFFWLWWGWVVSTSLSGPSGAARRETATMRGSG